MLLIAVVLGFFYWGRTIDLYNIFRYLQLELTLGEEASRSVLAQFLSPSLCPGGLTLTGMDNNINMLVFGGDQDAMSPLESEI